MEYVKLLGMNMNTQHTLIMYDKIKQLLENAEKTDSLAKLKWRIENREALREQRKKELKELMERDAAEAAMDEYNRIEEESEMDNYNEIKDEELYRPEPGKEPN
jgi:DNA-binding SARP family transcriptional activator